TSGFFLLRVYDMATATYVAVAINLAAGIVAFLLASRTDYTKSRETSVPARPTKAKRVEFVYIAIGISRLAPLVPEVAWTRLLSLLLGGTVYSFSIILAVFLFGLWFGSSAGAFVARRAAHPPLALAGCQVLLVLSIGWSAYALAYSLPYWPVDPWLSLHPYFNFQLDLVRC